MKKILLAGCLAAASALSANAEEENAAENTEVVENDVATDLLSAYDGLNLTIGLVFGSDKVEYNKNARVGQVDSWVVYNKDATEGSESSNTFAHSSDFASSTTFNPTAAGYYNNYVKFLKNTIHLDTMTVDAVKARNGNTNEEKSGYVFSPNAVIAPLTSYNGTKKIASAKSKFAVGGVFGVSYRKIIDNCNKLVAGLNFDLILRGKAKSTNNLGVKGVALAGDSKLYKADTITVGGGLAYMKNIKPSEREDMKTMIALATAADQQADKFKELTDVSSTEVVANKEIASTALFKVAKNSAAKEDDLKKALGVDDGKITSDVLDIAVVDENDSASQKVEHSAFMPMINASLGKVFNIANREMLIEATAGAALVKAKSKMVTKSQCVETKISKIAPTVGFNVSMMITNSIGGGFKANYIFNVKKNDVKVKSNWNAMVYVTIQPKSLNIW